MLFFSEIELHEYIYIYILLALVSCVSNEASSNKSHEINKTMRDKNSLELPSDEEMLKHITALIEECEDAKTLLNNKFASSIVSRQIKKTESIQSISNENDDLWQKLYMYRRNLNELISIKTEDPNLIELLMKKFQATYREDYKKLNDNSIKLRELKKSLD